MITMRDRHIALLLVRTGLFGLKRNDWRCIDIVPRGTPTARRMYERMKAAQTLDLLKHAPCCPANHWCGCRLIFQLCNCGAAQASRTEVRA